MPLRIHRFILAAGLLVLAAAFLFNKSTAQSGGVAVTWVNRSNATTSGSDLTPTAANGRGESSQAIQAGNGSLKVFAYNSGEWDGPSTSFGLTNAATFTGSTSEINYGWLTFGTVGSCRMNGGSVDSLPHNIPSGASLEVRINGTTVEYYINSDLICTKPDQTLSYPYRAAAVFTNTSAPHITGASMTGLDNLVPPAELSATNGGGNDINLTWSYPSLGQTGFKVERKLGYSAAYSVIATVGPTTLTYADTGSKDANRVYTYRVRAYRNAEESLNSTFAQATTPYTGGGSIRTDRAVYPKPTPAPPLPHAGGKWRDEVFGTEIMRATDEDDGCGSPGAGTWYNQWPTFNSDQSLILIRCGNSGDILIKEFFPETFTLGKTVRKTFGSGVTKIPTLSAGGGMQWLGATWSRNNSDKIWVVPNNPNTGEVTDQGPQIYTYSVSENSFSTTPIKSFVSTLASGQYFYEYHFAGTHADGDYDVFTASVKPDQNGSAARWLAWQRTGDRIIFNHDNANETHYNNCNPSKGGDYIYCGPDSGYTTRKIYRVSDLMEQDISSAPSASHGDTGTVWNVSRNNQGTFEPQERRNISDWNNTALPIFDWKDASGIQDLSNDCHTTLAADDENWVVEGCYDLPAYNNSDGETNAFENEIMQIKTDGSQSIRRLVHHRSVVLGPDAGSKDYEWGSPRPTITRDGRFIAFTSNWDGRDRSDLFIVKVPPPTDVTGLQYYPLAHPVRLLDTRPGQTACYTPGAPLAANASRTQPAVGTCAGLSIPPSAKALVGNATIISPPAGGHITLYPADAQLPTASNLNYVAGQVVPNAFTVGLNAAGAFNIYTPTSTNFIIDVAGYFAPPGEGGLYYHPLPRPVRLLDTRPGQTACHAPGAPLAANASKTEVAWTNCDGVVIPAEARAVVGNATVVSPPAGGYITLYPSGAALPSVSNLNYLAGQTIPNAFTVTLGGDGAFQIYTPTSTHFIADVAGYYSASAGPDANGVAGLLFYPLSAPARLLDTRAGTTACYTPGAPLSANSVRTQQARGTCAGSTVPTSALAILGNATVITPASDGYIILYPSGAAQPVVSNLNYLAGQVIPNAFNLTVGSDGAFNIYTPTQTHFIIDVAGYFAP